MNVVHVADWTDLAECRGQTDLFFDDTRVREAQQMCAACPVVEECGRAGADEVFGVWGGVRRRREVNHQRVWRFQCWECLVWFDARSPIARFCSDGCRNRAYLQRRVS